MELKRNKKAFFDYEHLQIYDAGIQLTGAEVKSVKQGHIDLEGSFITVTHGEALLVGAQISPYSKASRVSQSTHRRDRKKRLLLTKKELLEIAGKLLGKGLTVIPLSVYSSKRLVKVRIALARGKRKFDKRAAIKEKEYKRRLNSRVR